MFSMNKSTAAVIRDLVVCLTVLCVKQVKDKEAWGYILLCGSIMLKMEQKYNLNWPKSYILRLQK